MNQQINLYQPILRRERKVFSAQAIVVAVVLVAAGLAVLSGVVVWRLDVQREQVAELDRQRRALEDRLKVLEARYPVPQKDPALEARVTELQQEVNRKRRFLASFAEGTAETGDFGAALTGLARQPVEGLWLTGISLAGSGDLALRGKTLEPALVPRLVQKLGGEPAFAGRDFKGLRVERVDDSALRFQLYSREAAQ